MRQNTSITGCVRRSVGWSVGWSVTHSFDDPHVAPYCPTWPCSIQGAERKKMKNCSFFVFRAFHHRDRSSIEYMFSIFVLHLSKHYMSTKNEKTKLRHFRQFSWKKTKIKTFLFCKYAVILIGKRHSGTRMGEQRRLDDEYDWNWVLFQKKRN